MNKIDFDTSFEKRKIQGRTRFKTDWKRLGQHAGFQKTFGFKCSHCSAYVSSDEVLSGVQNRNHCPYCLWSKHVDLFEAGDRLAACKAPMQPIGLSMKQTVKKYGQNQGELMVVHLCRDCESLSINRIAADDDIDRLFELCLNTGQLDPSTLNKLKESNITWLDARHQTWLRSCLLGK